MQILGSVAALGLAPGFVDSVPSSFRFWFLDIWVSARKEGG